MYAFTLMSLSGTCLFYNFTSGELNQRINGPVNAHLISGPSISTKHTKHDYKWLNDSKYNDLL